MLSKALRTGIDRFVEQLLTGELPRRCDYGLTHFMSSLSSNHDEQAAEVVAYMSQSVQQATGGLQSVVFADRAYFAKTYKSGMTLALVPSGHDAASPEARLFEFSGATNGNRFSERATAEDIEREQAASVLSERRRTMMLTAQEFEADLKRKLLDKTRQAALEALARTTWSDERRTELANFFYVTDEKNLAVVLRTKINSATQQSELCRLLVALGGQDLMQL